MKEAFIFTIGFILGLIFGIFVTFKAINENKKSKSEERRRCLK